MPTIRGRCHSRIKEKRQESIKMEIYKVISTILLQPRHRCLLSGHGLLLVLVLLAAATRFADAQNCTTCQSTQDCNTNGQVCIVEREQCATPDATDASLFVFDLGCSCRNGEECVSGRCEGGIITGTCQAKLADGESCNEDSDCISGQCSFGFRCVVPSTAAPTTTLTSAPIPSPLGNNDSDGEDTNKGTGGTNQLEDDDDDDDDSVALLIGILFGVAVGVLFALFCCTSSPDSQGHRRACFGHCYCNPFLCDCCDFEING